MAGELERALSKRIGDTSSNDELLSAMRTLLVLLLNRIDKPEEETFEDELYDRITNKYSRPSSLANKLIPKPM